MIAVCVYSVGHRDAVSKSFLRRMQYRETDAADVPSRTLVTRFP